MTEFLPGYQLRIGSGLDRALLVQFMQRTYQELYPGCNITHLAHTVEQYWGSDTPLWWVEALHDSTPRRTPIACLWLGNAVDQAQGDRHAYIFLLYVSPAHRRRGIASALMRRAEAWARARGDRQIGLQVFQQNQPALRLYEQLGFQAQSIWMTKALS